MYEKCASSIPVSRLFGHSGFVDSVGCVDVDASDDTREITSLRGCLMWNDAAICGGRVLLKIFVRVWYDMCKYFERDSSMIFSVISMRCEYRDFSLLTRVQRIQRATAL